MSQKNSWTVDDDNIASELLVTMVKVDPEPEPTEGTLVFRVGQAQEINQRILVLSWAVLLAASFA